MKRQKKQRILTAVALSILMLSAFASLIKLQSATAASPSTNPSDLNFSKIACYLPNLGDGFPVFTDSFQTGSASNYVAVGNGTFSTAPGSATVNGSAFVMASNSAPFQVCNLCAKITATSSSGLGTIRRSHLQGPVKLRRVGIQPSHPSLVPDSDGFRNNHDPRHQHFSG